MTKRAKAKKAHKRRREITSKTKEVRKKGQGKRRQTEGKEAYLGQGSSKGSTGELTAEAEDEELRCTAVCGCVRQCAAVCGSVGKLRSGWAAVGSALQCAAVRAVG